MSFTRAAEHILPGGYTHITMVCPPPVKSELWEAITQEGSTLQSTTLYDTTFKGVTVGYVLCITEKGEGGEHLMSNVHEISTN